MVFTILRSLAGIVIGVALGMGVVIAGDMLHSRLFPLPEGFDVSRPEDVAALASQWPWQGFATMVVSWGAAAFAASGVAGLIAGRGPWPAWIAGGLMAAATAMNLILLPHPVWVWPAAGAALVLGIFAGARLGGRRAAA